MSDDPSRRIFGAMNSNAVKNIRAMTDAQIISQLRLPLRADLGPEAYTLYFAEVLARVLERTMQGKEMLGE